MTTFLFRRESLPIADRKSLYQVGEILCKDNNSVKYCIYFFTQNYL